MTKIFFIIFFSVFTHLAFGQTMAKLHNGLLADGQFVIIKDTNGFVYIREKPSKQAKIIDTLKTGKIIYCEDGPNGWLSVTYKKKNEYPDGYIHSSRVQLIEEFPAFRIAYQKDSLVKLKLDSVSILIKTGVFNKGKRKLIYDSSGLLISIDKRFPWGTDGEVPVTQYKSIHIKVGSKDYAMPNELYNDLFETTVFQTMAYMDKVSGKIYLIAFNSDGGGVYNVIWTILNGEIINRVVLPDPEA